jgi:hypothetical protein
VIAVEAAFEEAGFHQRRQPARQDVRSDVQALLELIEARCALDRIPEDEDAPPFADVLEAARDGAPHVLERRALHVLHEASKVTIIMQVTGV